MSSSTDQCHSQETLARDLTQRATHAAEHTYAANNSCFEPLHLVLDVNPPFPSHVRHIGQLCGVAGVLSGPCCVGITFQDVYGVAIMQP